MDMENNFTSKNPHDQNKKSITIESASNRHERKVNPIRFFFNDDYDQFNAEPEKFQYFIYGELPELVEAIGEFYFKQKFINVFVNDIAGKNLLVDHTYSVHRRRKLNKI
jgi:hypothetical protein